jgi:hypothetical protein
VSVTRNSRRDALYLVLLGAILLVSDWALSHFAGPSITPAFGRHVEVAGLIALGVLGVSAALLGGYRLVRTFGRDAAARTPST